MPSTYHNGLNLNNWKDYVNFAREHPICTFIFANPLELTGPLIGKYLQAELSKEEVHIVSIRMEGDIDCISNGSGCVFENYEPGDVLVMYVKDLGAKAVADIPINVRNALGEFVSHLNKTRGRDDVVVEGVVLKARPEINIVFSKAFYIGTTPGEYPHIQ